MSVPKIIPRRLIFIAGQFMMLAARLLNGSLAGPKENEFLPTNSGKRWLGNQNSIPWEATKNRLMEFRWWEIINADKTYFLVVTSEYIARINTSPDNNNKLAAQLERGKLPEEGLYKIPLNYVRKVIIDEGDFHLKVLFSSDSEEIYPINRTNQRFEIFDYLNKNSNHQGYELVKTSGLGAARKPIIAIVILSALFGWGYYVADGLERGVDMGYQLVVVLAVAGLGTKTLSLVYIGIMGIAFMGLFQKLMNPTVEHVLSYRK